MIDKAVILAAGQGSRLLEPASPFPKPLYKINGKPIISYVINSLYYMGVNKFFIVTGFRGFRLAQEVGNILPGKCEYTFLESRDWQFTGTSQSLAIVRGQFQGRFFLSMADHIFEPGIIETLANKATDPASLYLAMDPDVSKLDEDCTKVISIDNSILGIGKQLYAPSGIDTGLFICPQSVFRYTRKALGKDAKSSFSTAVNLMAQDELARAVSIGPYEWWDIDDRIAATRAEEELENKRFWRAY